MHPYKIDRLSAANDFIYSSYKKIVMLVMHPYKK